MLLADISQFENKEGEVMKTIWKVSNCTMFNLLLLSCLVLLMSSCSKKKEPESLPEYRVTGPEAYGAPGIKVGNKYWINVPLETSEDVIRRIVKKEIQSRKSEKVLLGDRLFTPTEITFFVYNKLSDFTKKEKIAGKDMADFVYEWSPSKGLVLTAKY